jgi:hypothetical protein
VNIRCGCERLWSMTSLCDRQSDAFNNPAKMACRIADGNGEKPNDQEEKTEVPSRMG